MKLPLEDYLNSKQVLEILDEQKVTLKPFGEIAIKMGLLTSLDISQLLIWQKKLASPQGGF